MMTGGYMLSTRTELRIMFGIMGWVLLCMDVEKPLVTLKPVR